MSSFLPGGSKVAFCHDYVELTTAEEAELIAGPNRGEDVEPQVEPIPNLAPKRRGRQPGSKNRLKEPGPPEERRVEESQTEPMHVQPLTAPALGRIEQLDTICSIDGYVPALNPEDETNPYSVSEDEDQPGSTQIASPPTPLLIIVQPDGTVVLSEPITKDNVTGIIRSLIDPVDVYSVRTS